MMIVIEGPDGGGKTTLLKAIREAYPTWSFSPKTVNSDTSTLVDLADFTQHELEFHRKNPAMQPTLYDRFPLISEPIYGSILRGRAREGFVEVRDLLRLWSQWSAVIPMVIYCLPPREVVLNNVWNDKNNQKVAPHIGEIYDAYVARIAHDTVMSENPPLVWDYTDSASDIDMVIANLGIAALTLQAIDEVLEGTK